MVILLFLADLGAKIVLFSYLQLLSICVCFFQTSFFCQNCKKTLLCRAFCVEHATWGTFMAGP